MIFDKKKERVKKVSRCKLGKSKNKNTEFEEFIYGNVWFRQMEFIKKGAIKEGHKHNFDHIHFVMAGAVEAFELVEIDKKITKKSLGVLKAGDKIKVPKNVAHTIVALEDNSMALCLQAVRDGEADVLETNYLKDTEDVSETIL